MPLIAIVLDCNKLKLFFVSKIIVCKESPLEETKVINDFDVKCHVKGGGLSGQAGAVIHGLSRALVQADPNLKKNTQKKQVYNKRFKKSWEKKIRSQKST